MSKAEKRIVKNVFGNILSALLFIALGMLLVAYPGSAVESVAKLFGIGLIVSGVINAIMFFALKDRGSGLFLSAIVSLIFGVLIVLKPAFFANFFPILMGLYIFIRGLGDLGHVIALKRIGSKKWMTALIVSVIIMMLGALVFLHPAFVEKSIVTATGLAMIISGLADLALFLRARS